MPGFARHAALSAASCAAVCGTGRCHGIRAEAADGRTVRFMSTHEGGFVRLPTLSAELKRIPDAAAAVKLLGQTPVRRSIPLKRLDCRCGEAAGSVDG